MYRRAARESWDCQTPPRPILEGRSRKEENRTVNPLDYNSIYVYSEDEKQYLINLDLNSEIKTYPIEDSSL